MPTSQEIIRASLDTARNSWEAYTVTQADDLINILIAAESQIVKKIAAVAKEDVIKYARLNALHQAIEIELKHVRTYLSGLIRDGMDYTVRRALQDSITAIGTAGIYTTASVGFSSIQFSTINKEAIDHLIRYRPWGFSLSKDIWNVTWQTQRQLFQRLGTAIITGEKIATLIPDVSAILGVKETGANIVAGKGIYKSAAKNATRLIRTELNRAYIEGQMRYVKVKPFITGTIHRTGSGNPCPDCSDLEGTFYPKDENSEIPVHPNCMCYLEYVVK